MNRNLYLLNDENLLSTSVSTIPSIATTVTLATLFRETYRHLSDRYNIASKTNLHKILYISFQSCYFFHSAFRTLH